MSTFGKPNATGRSSGIRSGRQRKIHSPPAGEAWTWLTRELLRSPAWRARSINCTRLVDFLLVEHCNHAGLHNGKLLATYDQLVEWGIRREAICDAIDEAEFLGLVRVEVRGRFSHGARKVPSEYRLTFFASHDNAPATNEWKAITEQHVAARKNAKRKSAQRKFPSTGFGRSPVPLSVLRGGKNG